jgi:signal transduction histidine kinase
MSDTVSNAGALLDSDAPVPQPAALTPTDLAEMLSVFNTAATKLQATHECLQTEVARLQRELKTVNEELQRSKRLAALGEMAAGISHEVRNPLGSIRLHARMLEQDLADMPEQRTLAEKILSAVRGLDGVVGDVLAFSKEMNVVREPIAADEVLQAAVDECVASAGVEFGGSSYMSASDLPVLEVIVEPTHVSPGISSQINCDAGLVHRALTNVIRNAIQAMTPELTGGKRKLCAVPARRALMVTASSRRVVGSDGGERTMIVLSVRDTGPGLGEEVIQRMFNPFFTTRATGTGLGLAIVHRIMDAHGGTVKVRNHEQGGAVVELLFPATESGLSGNAEQLGTPEVVVTGECKEAFNIRCN